MPTFSNLVCLCVLAALCTNGIVHVNIDATISFSAMALILLTIFRR